MNTSVEPILDRSCADVLIRRRQLFPDGDRLSNCLRWKLAAARQMQLPELGGSNGSSRAAAEEGSHHTSAAAAAGEAFFCTQSQLDLSDSVVKLDSLSLDASSLKMRKYSVPANWLLDNVRSMWATREIYLHPKYPRSRPFCLFRS